MFKDFKTAVGNQFLKMQPHNLFVTDVDKDTLWETYLSSFPEGSNPVFRERTEHDCQCCKSFIRAVGNVVAIIDGRVESLWDTTLTGDYGIVSGKMAELVKSKSISNIFLHTEGTAGTDKNYQALESGETLTWEHFFIKIPPEYVVRKDDKGTKLSEARSTRGVFFRSLSEITVDALETVIELIDQNSLYRGEENRFAVAQFREIKRLFDPCPEQDLFCWLSFQDVPQSVTNFRNTAIGTLVTDLSEGRELGQAVASFEAKVAPTNYKRPTALITKAMIQRAQDEIDALGYTSALDRRYAVAEDITINNVLFADRTARKRMNVFDELASQVPEDLKKLDKVEEVGIESFISKIMPSASSIELMLENRHTSNMVSLIAPVDPTAKGMFKWHNNFSWAYAGEVADSLREKVKKLGGRVDGVFRFTHSWNRLEPNRSLMDLHVFMPGNNHTDDKIHDRYGSGRRVGWNCRNDHSSGGVQDVDYTEQAKEGFVPVENITFPSLSKMPEGKYICKIHNWNFRLSGGRGEAEIEFDGNIFKYEYPPTRNKEWVTVAVVTLKNGRFTIEHKLEHGQTSKEAWGVNTQKFHNVSMVMYSPNHWDSRTTGNRHFFFMIENCLNPGQARGFFNEFLTDELRDHRKVFEVLGSKMKTEESDNQLSGLGFSSTQRNSVLCRVNGSFSRVIKIIF